MHAFQSPLLSQIPGVIHGFGTAAEPIPAPLTDEWARLKPQWRQVHGAGVAEVEHAGQDCGDVDALYTSRPHQAVAVVTADCVPILLARRDGAKVAAVHAGWRGTRARILEALWRSLVAEGETGQGWVAAVGPSIGPCCYEVSKDLAEDFRKEFGAPAVVPRPRILDLPEANAQQLRNLGIQNEILRACTRCLMKDGNHVFHSYRRNPNPSRQWSMIRTAR